MGMEFQPKISLFSGFPRLIAEPLRTGTGNSRNRLDGV